MRVFVNRVRLELSIINTVFSAFADAEHFRARIHGKSRRVVRRFRGTVRLRSSAVGFGAPHARLPQW